MDPSLIAPVAVVAMLAIRTALAEIRDPGSARQHWSFLCNRRAIAVGAATASILSVGGWQAAGFAAMPWAVLAGTLVAYIGDLRTSPEAEATDDQNGGRH
ncbi:MULTISPECIES: hypothetical protein [unclassified Streptomyces]|uniref:hypothetical protein n=1 Tax=unclassified Streptomyces TaxID=2593676 RepID=UPI00386F1D2F|nr:hypothetical protein OG569_00090 [Streptomyces sp. NBC_00827]